MTAVTNALLLVAVFVSLALVAYGYRKRPLPEATSFTLFSLGFGLWAAGSFGEGAANSLAASILWTRFKYLGVTLVPAAWFIFTVRYTGHDEYLTRRRIAGLAAIAALTVLAVWTNDHHSLYYATVTPDPTVRSGYAVTHGILYNLWFVVGYGLVLGGCLLLAEMLFHDQELYRQQAGAVLVAAAAPLLANFAYYLNVTAVDFTPVAFAASGVALGWAMHRFEFMDVTPVARKKVVDTLQIGVMVLDDTDRVVDVNPAARRLLNASPDETLVGNRLADVLDPPFDDILDRFEDATDASATDTGPAEEGTGPVDVGSGSAEEGTGPVDVGSGSAEEGTGPTDDQRDSAATSQPDRTSASAVLHFDTENGRRFLGVDARPFDEATGYQRGRLLYLQDVTDRERRERELERQNEQLDRFASLVSHDLRNPLNVAEGYVSTVQETGDLDALDDVQDAHERMRDLIDDVLDLARTGRTVTDVEPVELERVAQRAWAGVDTGDATLELDADAVVLADASRLQQLLENLIRNAIQHGGADVTVTIGADVHGFYVADDGPGIPEHERDQILDDGYTTHPDGTGLGLSIVTSIATAHGWTVTVTESADGGARFSITGTTFEREAMTSTNAVR